MQQHETKNIVIVIIGVAVTIAALVGAYIIFSEDKNKGDGKTTASTTTASSKPSTAINPLVQTTVKDSVLKSTDAGDSFLPYFTIAMDKKKLGLADVLSISFHPEIENKIIVTTFEDGLFVNENKENLWTPISFPPKRIYSFLLDKNSPNNRVFASGVVENNGRIFRTEDAGVSWKAVYAEPGVGTYVSALAQHPQNTDIILAGTNKGTIVKSLDAGSSWKNIGGKIDGTITHFTFDAKDKRFAYFLAYQKSVYFSRDEGTTWLNWEEEKKKEVDALKKQSQELSKSGDKEGAKELSERASALSKRNTEDRLPAGILLITADPLRSGTIYAGASSGLYRSTDFGKYWKKINIIESAEKFPIRSIAINPENSSEIVFVSGKSFYRSTSAGETWSVTPLAMTRNAAFVSYDPFDSNTIFIGASSK